MKPRHGAHNLQMDHLIASPQLRPHEFQGFSGTLFHKMAYGKQRNSLSYFIFLVRFAARHLPRRACHSLQLPAHAILLNSPLGNSKARVALVFMLLVIFKWHVGATGCVKTDALEATFVHVDSSENAATNVTENNPLVTSRVTF